MGLAQPALSPAPSESRLRIPACGIGCELFIITGGGGAAALPLRLQTTTMTTMRTMKPTPPPASKTIEYTRHKHEWET